METREMEACPTCGGTQWLVYTVGGFKLRQCNACQLAYVSPATEDERKRNADEQEA